MMVSGNKGTIYMTGSLILFIFLPIVDITLSLFNINLHACNNHFSEQTERELQFVQASVGGDFFLACCHHADRCWMDIATSVWRLRLKEREVNPTPRQPLLGLFFFCFTP